MTKKRSELASALRAILDESCLLTRKDWARLLGVSPAAISMWVNDRTLPRAQHLRMAWDFVSSSTGVPETVLDRFRRVAALPARHATLFSEHLRGEATIGHYMLRPVREAFLRTLGGVEPSLQEELLYDMAERCRQLRQENVSAATKLVSVPWMLAPGTVIRAFPELGTLFQINWKNISVFGWKPRDGRDEFFGSVVRDLLSRDAPGGFRMFYGVPSSQEADVLRKRIKEIQESLPSELYNRAEERIRVIEVPKASISRMMESLPQDGKPELLVALDVGEPSQCGYAWYPGDIGVVVDQTAIAAIDYAVGYEAENNVLTFPVRRKPAEPSDLPPPSLAVGNSQ